MEAHDGGHHARHYKPVWPVSPVAGVTTQADGTAVWTFLGSTPGISVDHRVAKATTQERRAQVTTTTATASQVILSGGVVESVDLALPDNAVTRVKDIVTLHKPATAHGGSIKIDSDWVRNAAGAPAQIGTSVIVSNLTGATLDGLTVAHVANGNRIELQCSPETAESLNWRVFRTQSEGSD